MKSLSILVCLCCWMHLAIAQDAHFSQPLMSPLNFNPAMTGYMQEVYRLNFQSRGQWWTVANKEYYKTISASFDRRFCGEKNHFGLGLQVLGNELWDNPLSSYQIQLSAAYHLNLGNGIFGALGGQGGFLQYRLNDSKLYFEDQFDPSISSFGGSPSQENFAKANLGAWDGNVGLLLYSTDENNNFTLGFSLHHLNQPQITFLDKQSYSVDGLSFKWTVYGRAKFLLSDNSGIFFSPTAIIQLQDNQWQSLLGFTPSIGFSPEKGQGGKYIYQKTVSLGVSIRLAAHFESATTLDAVIIQSAYRWKSLRFVFAYDINTSNLRLASNRAGAMELGISYQFGSQSKECKYCPYW